MSSVNLVARLRPHAEAMIVNTLIKLQVNAKAQSTIKANEYVLKHLSKHVNLLEPEEVKKFVSEAKTKKGKPIVPETKNKWLFCYNNFCKYNGIKWIKPYYKVPESTPLIPITQDVQAIINNSSEKYVVVFTIEAETGASPEELHLVTRDKINLEKRQIHITGVKGHGSRPYSLKTPQGLVQQVSCQRDTTKRDNNNNNTFRQTKNFLLINNNFNQGACKMPRFFGN